MESTTADDRGGDYEISSPSAFARKPTVSVVLVTYNHGDYLEQAIEGVLSQQVDFPIELLIGEDCSTDNSREIALRFQNRNSDTVRVISSDVNVGALRNYRRILRAARGEFIAHLDGDDYWLPGKLARQVAFLQEHQECTAAFTNAVTVDREGRRRGLFNDAGEARFDLAALLSRGNFLNSSSMVFRETARQMLLDIPRAYLDYEGHLTLARTGFLAQIGDPLTVYRINSSGSMVAQANERVRELYWQAILSVPRERVSDDDFALGLSDFLRRVAFRAMRTRQWRLLREWAPRVFTASPFGRTRTSLLTLASILRILRKEFAGLFVKDADGHHLRVLYRR